MATPEDFDTPARTTIFSPHRLNRHIMANHSRALAVFDIVSHLISEGCAPIDKARTALARNQPYQAAHLLHNLKASSGNLGGQRVCEAIGELEPYIESSASLPIIDTLIDKLEQELQLFLKAADKWLSEQQLAQYALYGKPQALSERQLLELIQCLEENDLKALDVFSEMADTFQVWFAADDYDQLNMAINDLNFPLALQYMEHHPDI